MEVAHRAHRAEVHICVCIECGTTLSVPEEAMARFRKNARR